MFSNGGSSSNGKRMVVVVSAEIVMVMEGTNIFPSVRQC